jgi:hypothetical protein
MLGLAFIITLSFLALILGIHTYTRHVNPGLPGMKKDVLKLRGEVDKMAADLVPIDKNELDLLSGKLVGQRLKKRIFSRRAKGFITSIFDEPLLAYAVRKYPTSSSKTIYYARSRKTELVFIRTRKGVQLYIDGKAVGRLKNNQILELKENQKLGELVASPSLPEEVRVGNKKVALLNADTDSQSVHPRLFRFIGPVSTNEKKLLLALVVYKLLVNNDK